MPNKSNANGKKKRMNELNMMVIIRAETQSKLLCETLFQTLGFIHNKL